MAARRALSSRATQRGGATRLFPPAAGMADRSGLEMITLRPASCVATRRLAATHRSVSRLPRRLAARSTLAMAAKRVLVPIGRGSEEMEAVVTIDVLRRAGAEVRAAASAAVGAVSAPCLSSQQPPHSVTR